MSCVGGRDAAVAHAGAPAADVYSALSRRQPAEDWTKSASRRACADTYVQYMSSIARTTQDKLADSS